MTYKPFWVDGESDEVKLDLLVTDPADIALASAKIATKAAKKAVAALPKPERDVERAAWTFTEERRAYLGSRPTRRRWKALVKLDERVDAAWARLEQARVRVAETEQVLAGAPADDARALAAWIEKGEKGSRPELILYERQRDVDAAKIFVQAAEVEVDRVLEERRKYVERNREQLLADARRDVDDAQQKLLARLADLPALRAALIEARETLTWCAHYPDPPQTYGFASDLALGLRRPVEETLSTPARLPYTNVLEALRRDAERSRPPSPERRRSSSAPRLQRRRSTRRCGRRSPSSRLGRRTRSSVPANLPAQAAMSAGSGARSKDSTDGPSAEACGCASPPGVTAGFPAGLEPEMAAL